MTSAQKVQNEETAAQIGEAVAAAVAAKLNGDRMPKDWREFSWMTARAFGFASIPLLVLMGIAWKCIPPFMDAQIANIRVQTENIAKQTTTLDDLTEAVAGIAECEIERAKFRESVTKEHSAMVDVLDTISTRLEKTP